MADIVKAVRAANPTRHNSNLERRMLKLVEEVGEASQALLAVTSVNNGKKKTWDDVREEITDVIVVAIDIALTAMPDQDDKSADEVQAIIEKEVARKLKKWVKKRSSVVVDNDKE